MATQLRAVPTYHPADIAQIIGGLDDLRDDLFEALPGAEEINFSFGGPNNRIAGQLKVMIKTGKRETREALLIKLQSNPIPGASFSNLIEGVETGARRRLTITAEVR